MNLNFFGPSKTVTLKLNAFHSDGFDSTWVANAGVWKDLDITFTPAREGMMYCRSREGSEQV